MATKKKTDSVAVQVAPLTEKTIEFHIRGTAPLVQNKFSAKAKDTIKTTQEAGSQAKGKKVREAKDFGEVYEGAMHRGPNGEYGIPAPAFRNAMISACRTVGFKMTHAKLAAWVEPDFFDADDGTPLVRLIGEPEKHMATVRNATGVVDLRCRPMWREWEAVVRVTFDEGMFSTSDITNLMVRAGRQVGIGEGRPDSRSSAGMGWGLFEVI